MIVFHKLVHFGPLSSENNTELEKMAIVAISCHLRPLDAIAIAT